MGVSYPERCPLCSCSGASPNYNILVHRTYIPDWYLDVEHGAVYRNRHVAVKLQDGGKAGETITFLPAELPDSLGPSGSDMSRETWGKKIDFLLSVIGFAVDLANVWRFPYLCYKNGGGAFLIPYVLMLIFGGIPLFYMELALGQYVRKGAITCWGSICPLFKGVGLTVVMIAFYTDFFYNVIISWALYFFFASFAADLPWTTCNHTWNSPTCYDGHMKRAVYTNDEDQTQTPYNSSYNSTSFGVTSMPRYFTAMNSTGNYSNITTPPPRTYPADEYFNFAVLGQGEMTNIENIGTVRWQLAICLLAVYIICYFSLWKGISMSGKVVWFTAVFPYVVLLILFCRGVTLPGAFKGIKYYMTPDIQKLSSATPWVDAATQVYFSLGPGFGVLLAFASYNKFNNNVYHDAILTSAVNCGTSFISGFVVFSVIGYLAEKRQVDISQVVNDDPGLVFTVYPEALATLPGATFWSVIFFLMLLTLGLDSSFGGSEAIITAFSDEFPIIKRRREFFVLGLFVFYYSIGMTQITQGGIYVLTLLERYSVTYSILLAVLCETVIVSWIYGVDKFRDNIKEMTGSTPGIFWKICWKYIAPVFILFNVAYGLSEHKPLTMGKYVFPAWANVIGWVLAASSIQFIFTVAIYKIITTPGSLRQRIRFLLTPAIMHSSGRENGTSASAAAAAMNIDSANEAKYDLIIQNTNFNDMKEDRV